MIVLFSLLPPQVAAVTACNYFNTNYAHVLRTLHFPSIACVPGLFCQVCNESRE